MPTGRDEFSDKTKRTLADRVGWKCSYPDCGAATIGPHTEYDKTTLLGEAAHITAAASGGPRYDSRLTSEQRSHISNGIWMCRMHSRLVDVDEDNFSENTLRLWKSLAEQYAYEALGQGPMPGASPEPDTLVALGLRIVMKGVWLSAGNSKWRFRNKGFCRGDLKLLRDEIGKNSIQFVVVESQGDGRAVTGPVEWENVDDYIELTIPVAERAQRRDPNKILDFALTPDGDLAMNGGDLSLVRGIQAAVQEISLVMGSMLGEHFMYPEAGSLIALYYHRYAGDLNLLGRLFALEIARLATISVGTKPPALNTVWRVNYVKISDLALTDQRLSITVDLEWSDGQRWNGIVPIYIHENLDKLPALAGT